VSQESVKVVQRSIEAYNRRSIAAMSLINTPDMEIDWSASPAPTAGIYRGRESVLRFLADYFEAFEEIIIEPDRFIDAGEMVVVPNVSRSRGRDGIEVVARSTLVFTIRDRMVCRICLYQETEEALKAVGLAEAPD
jgi:ketosteroid isomerase-like protein